VHLTPETVATEHEWLRGRADIVVPLLNDVRSDLGDAFGVSVDPVTREEYLAELDAVFADGDVAVNVAALSGLLRDLDVAEDYPGFVVDEFLGRRLAATIAGGAPLSLLAEATFHYADITAEGQEGETAGMDDLDAALAAGFQTCLPGWSWREGPSRFAVANDR